MQKKQFGKTGMEITPIGLGAWTLHNPAVTAAIVGSRHPGQVEETVASAEFRLSENEYEQIRRFLAVHQ